MGSRIARRIRNPLPYQGSLTIANAITDVTRLAGVQGDGAAYPDSSVGVWPAATNLCTNGGFETNTSGWTTYNGGSGTVTLTRSSAVSKYGSYSGLFVTDGASTSQQAIMTAAAAPAVSTSTTYSCSAWVYSVAGGETVRVRINWILGAAYVSASVGATTVLSAGWQRLTVTATSPASGIDHAQPVIDSTLASPISIYIDGIQFETGSIATPYIETDGGTASRSAGRIQMPADVLDETRMWALVRLRSAAAYNYTTGGSNRIFQFQDSGSERLILQHIPGDKFYLDRASGGSSGATSGALNYANGDSLTLACRFSPTAVGLSINGGAFTSAANTAIPTLSASTFDIGSNEGVGQWPGNILWFAAGLGTLTNADAALFHAWGNNDPLPHMFPAAAQLSFLAHFNGDGKFYRRAA